MTPEEHEEALKDRWRAAVSEELTLMSYHEWKATQLSKWRVTVDRTEVRSLCFDVMAYSAAQAEDTGYEMAANSDYHSVQASEPEYDVTGCEEVEGE